MVGTEKPDVDLPHKCEEITTLYEVHDKEHLILVVEGEEQPDDERVADTSHHLTLRPVITNRHSKMRSALR